MGAANRALCGAEGKAMSYSVGAYAVDLGELAKVIGSKDEALLAALIADNPELGEPDEEAEEEDQVSESAALRHLVMGETPHPPSAYQYGYALEELCRHLGEWLPGDLWTSIRWTVLEETGFQEILKKTDPPVPLPPSEDFPRIGHLSAEQVRAMVQKMGPDGHLTTAAPSGKKGGRSLRTRVVTAVFSRLLSRREAMTAEDVREMLDEYEAWLREAASKGKALVFFYY